MSKAKPKKPIRSSISDFKSWVFIVNEFDNNNDSIIIDLRHPKSGSSAPFFCSSSYDKIQEIHVFNDPFRSYFIDNSVKSDGKLHLCTPVDPLFLILPLLRQESRCCPIDQVLRDDDFPQISELAFSKRVLNTLSAIADQRGDKDLNAFVYNEEKTLNWLSQKVRRTADILKSKGIHVGSNIAISANFVRGSLNQDTDENYLKYSFGLVSEYLEDEMSSKLKSHLNIPDEVEPQKRKSISTESSNAKKAKLDDDVEVVDEVTSPTPVNKENAKPKQNTSAKSKALAKGAAKSRNIMSFFKAS